MKKRIALLIVIALLASAMFSGCSSNTASDSAGGSESKPAGNEKVFLNIATANIGGTYYPVGVGMSTLWNDKLKADGIQASAFSSAGSVENIDLLKNKEADLAILQGLVGAQAWQGDKPFEGKPYKEMRSISSLWFNVEQFVVTEDVVKTGNIMDVKGLHFAIGAAGSGTEGSNLIILEGIGLDPRNDIIPEYLGSSQSVQAIQDGRIDGTSIPAGIPSPAFTELYSGTTKVRHLEITDEQLKAINKIYPAWGPEIIKAGTYPNQNEDIKTIRQPNFLAVNADVSEDVVYKLTKTLHENVEYLHQVHSATEQITLESCLVGLPIPLHPGAVKYYKEIGLEIPERLIP